MRGVGVAAELSSPFGRLRVGYVTWRPFIADEAFWRLSGVQYPRCSNRAAEKSNIGGGGFVSRFEGRIGLCATTGGAACCFWHFG